MRWNMVKIFSKKAAKLQDMGIKKRKDVNK